MRRAFAVLILMAALAAPEAGAACLRFGDLGLEPPERGGPHRLRGEIADKLLARAGLDKKTDIWVSAEPPYFLVTVIYLRGSCLVRAEQLGLQDLIALAAAPLPARRPGDAR